MILKLKKDDLISAEALPDEHIYSVVSTAYVRSGYQNPYDFSTDYVIPHFKNRRIYPFFSIFEDPYQIFSHTVYFDLLNVLPKEIQREVVQEIISGEVSQGSFASKLKTGLVQRSGLYGKYPLYCPVCALEDMDIGLKGSPYIRTYHNTGGITVCPHHGARLIELKEPLFKNIDTSETEIEWGEDFERRIAKTLMNFRGLNKEILDQALYDQLLKGNYIKTTQKKIHVKKLLEDLYDKYPEDFLITHKIERRPSDKSWDFKLLKKDQLTHPFYYALLFDLLDFDINELYYYKCPETLCINSYCTSSDTKLLFIKKEKKYYRCRSCNMIFTDNNKILQYGEVFQEGVRKDYASGMSLYGIGKKTGRDSKAIENMINDRIDPIKIDRMIREYREIAQKYEFAKDLNSDYPNVYRYLSQYDRDWLIERFGDPGAYKKGNVFGHHAIQERIKELDEKYFNKLVTLEGEIGDDPKKRTRKFYTDLLGVSNETIFGRKKYIKTIEYIDSHTETTEEYHNRIALPVLRDLIGDGLAGDDLRKSFLKTFNYRPWAKTLYDDFIKSKDS